MDNTSFEIPPRVKVAQELAHRILYNDMSVKYGTDGVTPVNTLLPESDRLLKVSTNLLISYMLGEHGYNEKIEVEEETKTKQNVAESDQSCVVFTE